MHGYLLTFCPPLCYSDRKMAEKVQPAVLLPSTKVKEHSNGCGKGAHEVANRELAANSRFSPK